MALLMTYSADFMCMCVCDDKSETIVESHAEVLLEHDVAPLLVLEIFGTVVYAGIDIEGGIHQPVDTEMEIMLPLYAREMKITEPVHSLGPPHSLEDLP